MLLESTHDCNLQGKCRSTENFRKQQEESREANYIQHIEDSSMHTINEKFYDDCLGIKFSTETN